MAKKSKDFRELLKQQRSDQIQHRGFEKLQQKVQQGAWGQKFADIVANPQGEVKMSEVLEAFVAPYLDAATTLTQREKLFSIAVVAWNLAMMPEDERQPFIHKLIHQGLKGHDFLAQRDTQEILDTLIARKQALFAHHQRYIVDFQLQDLGEEFHLSVASTLMKQSNSNS